MLPTAVVGIEAAYAQGSQRQPMVGPPAALRRMMEARAAALDVMVEERSTAAAAASPRESPQESPRESPRGASPPVENASKAREPRQALGFNFVG